MILFHISLDLLLKLSIAVEGPIKSILTGRFNGGWMWIMREFWGRSMLGNVARWLWVKIWIGYRFMVVEMWLVMMTVDIVVRWWLNLQIRRMDGSFARTWCGLLYILQNSLLHFHILIDVVLYDRFRKIADSYFLWLIIVEMRCLQMTCLLSMLNWTLLMKWALMHCR